MVDEAATAEKMNAAEKETLTEFVDRLPEGLNSSNPRVRDPFLNEVARLVQARKGDR